MYQTVLKLRVCIKIRLPCDIPDSCRSYLYPTISGLLACSPSIQTLLNGDQVLYIKLTTVFLTIIECMFYKKIEVTQFSVYWKLKKNNLWQTNPPQTFKKLVLDIYLSFSSLLCKNFNPTRLPPYQKFYFNSHIFQ